MTSTRRLVVSYVVALTVIAGWSTLSFGELRTFLNRQQDVAEAPIAALAANAMKGDEERCLHARRHPNSQPTAEDCAMRWFRRNPEPASDQAPADGADATVLDEGVVNAARASLKDKFSMMVEFYLEDAADHIAQIQAGLADDDPQKVVVPAHTLKSSSRQIGATQVGEIAAWLEEAARTAEGSQSDVAPLSARAAELNQAFTVLRPRLERLIGRTAA